MKPTARIPWKSLAADGWSRWQARKYWRWVAQHHAPKQVKSLGAQNAERARAGSRVDAGVQATDAEVQVPNWCGYCSPFESEIAVQTAAAADPEPLGLADSATVRARRITDFDEAINQCHRGFLYVGQEIQALERQNKYDIQSLCNEFDEWDARMKRFQFVMQSDSFAQTGLAKTISESAVLPQASCVSDPPEILSEQVTGTGVWRELQRHEVRHGLSVRVTAHSPARALQGCCGVVQDSYWAIDDLTSGEPMSCALLSSAAEALLNLAWVIWRFGTTCHTSIPPKRRSQLHAPDAGGVA